MKTRYCTPWNAGLASETSAVCRRLGRLITAMDTEINEMIVEQRPGQPGIVADLREFRQSMCAKLEAEGWTYSYDGGNRMKVRPPGHRKPFTKHNGA